MSFKDLVDKSREFYPDLQIKFKNESKFMILLSYLLFFNKEFMTNYTTTIGSTVYFPDKTSVEARPTSGSLILLHELVHIADSKKTGGFLFKLLYLFPQILVLFCLPLLFFSWKIALPLLILFCLPLPAYFRMRYEKRAYFVTLYALKKISDKLSLNIDLQESKKTYLKQFKGSYYYFMWPFSNIDSQFDDAVSLILQGKPPFEDKIFNIIDILLDHV